MVVLASFLAVLLPQQLAVAHAASAQPRATAQHLNPAAAKPAAVAPTVAAAGRLSPRLTWATTPFASVQSGGGLLASPSPSYMSTVLADVPLIYYRLDDTACCAVVDSSGTGLTGSYPAGGISYGNQGLISGDPDTAIASDGTSIPVTRDAGVLPSAGARTIELWEKTTSTNTQTLLSYGDLSVTAGYFQVSIRPGSQGTVLQFIGGNDDAGILTPYPIDDGRPHQIALTYDGASALTFFVDGQQIGQFTLTTALNTQLAAQPLYAGYGVDGRFTGVLDEVALYRAALSPTQLNAHWRVGNAAGACPTATATGYAAVVGSDNPIRYFRLDESGQIEVDQSATCRFGAYGPSLTSTAGLLTGDADAAVATGFPTGTVVSSSADGLPSTGARTFELWEETTNTSWQTLLSYGSIGVSAGYFQLSIRPGAHGTAIQFIGGNDDAQFLTPYPIDDGQPHQIAITYDGTSSIAFFVDGQQVGRATLVTPLNTVTSAQALELGYGVDGAFHGTFDEFAVYGAALTQARIDAHWRAGAGGAACPSTPTTGYAGAVAADHPVRYYRVGDSGLTAADSSGNCRDAAYLPNAQRSSGLLTADPDGAVASSGQSAAVLSVSPDGLPSTGPRTIELWEQTTNTSWQTLVSYGDIGLANSYFQLSIRPGAQGTVLQFVASNDDAGFLTPYPIDDGAPHHIVVTYDASNVLTLYVDGQEVGHATLTPLTTSLGAQAFVLASGVDGPFTGVLDELAIYPTALSSSTVSAHYQAGALPPGYSLLSGVALAGGNGLSGVNAQACPTMGTGQCFFSTPTGSLGLFHITVPNGSYAITAFPPAGSQYLSAKTVGPFTVAPSVSNISIAFSSPLPTTGTLTSPGGGTTTGGVPNVNWAQPSTYTVDGCANGYGFLEIKAISTQTGRPDWKEAVLTETPSGSGHYVGQIPPLTPLHGLGGVSQYIACPGQTTLLPDGGAPAGGTPVLVMGTGFTGATAVSFGGTPATSFQVLHDTLIKAVSPAGTGSVAVVVTLADASTVTIGTFTYIAVTSLNPNSGPASGGDTVRIFGQGFTDVRGVMFGLTKAQSFSVLNSTTIDAVSPAGIGTVDVHVINSFAVTAAVTGSLYTYTNGPPGSFVINEGTGPNAQQVLAAQLLSSDFCAQSVQATQIVQINFDQACGGAQTIIDEEGPGGVLFGVFLQALVVAPALGAILLGFGDAAVVTATLAVIDIALPLLAVLLLALAVFVFWQEFIDPAGTVADTFGNPITAATATIKKLGSGGVYAPVIASSGKILPAINPETTDATGAFEWDAVAGTYRIDAMKSGCQVPGDTSQSTVSTDPFAIPPPMTGLLLTLDCPGGSAPAPTVLGVFPSIGPSSGGDQIAITGTGLAGNPHVFFGSTPASSVTVLSPYALVATAPADTTPTVDVTVTTAGGTSATGTATKYRRLDVPSGTAAPAITSLNPASGPQAGLNTVKVFGSRLTGTFQVTFGGVPANQLNVVSDTEVDVVAPASSSGGAVRIILSGPNGSSPAVPADVYTYVSPLNHSTTTSLTSSRNPSVYGSSITLTATVTANGGGTPTGSVSFVDTSSGATLCASAALSAGIATCSTSALSAGSHSLSAGYPGAGSFTSSSDSLTQVVTTAPLTVKAASASRYFGTANPMFTGTITGLQNGDSITATYSSTATATSAPGSYDIVPQLVDPLHALANYDVTLNNGVLTVQAVPTATTLVISPSPAYVGQTVTFTATVTSKVAAPDPTAEGSVAFSDGTTSLGTVALSGGNASYSTSALAVGSHTITASYSGTANFIASSSAGTLVTISAVPTATSLSSSLNPSISGQVVTLTATVTSTVAAPGPSTEGSVTFKDGGAVLATVGLSGGQASLTTSALAAGTHTITASYSGTADFAASSANLTQRVRASTIVFVSNRDGNFEIYLMNPDGSGQKRLTNNSASDTDPAPSPDGTKIVFTSNRSGSNQLWVMNSDGTNPVRLTNDCCTDQSAAWSPDGRSIAYSSNRSGGWQIWKVNADGTSPTRLTSNSSSDTRPAWSTTNKIAFISNRSGQQQVWVMNADGSGQMRITTDGAHDDYPAWSPDGAKIAYASDRSGSWQIWTAKSDGSSATQLTHDANATDRMPTWSPDGARVAFASNVSGSWQVMVIGSSGTGETRITSGATNNQPNWCCTQ